MDPATRRNLELDESLAGKAGAHARRRHSTPRRPRWAAARCAAGSIARCAISDALRERYQAVGDLDRSVRGLERLARRLRSIGDLERILARIALRSARPRDLAQLRAALAHLPRLAPGVAQRARGDPLAAARALAARHFGDHREEHALLERAVVDSPPHFLRDGGVIAAGYDAELDELRLLGSNTEQFLLDLERRERERTGLSSLKLGFNRVQGFFIEVNRSQAEPSPRTTCAVRPSNPRSDSSPQSSRASKTRFSGRASAHWRARRSCTMRCSTGSDRAPARLQATADAIAELDVLTLLRGARGRRSIASSPSSWKSRCCGSRAGAIRWSSVRAREPFIPNDLRSMTRAAC